MLSPFLSSLSISLLSSLSFSLSPSLSLSLFRLLGFPANTFFKEGKKQLAYLYILFKIFTDLEKLSKALQSTLSHYNKKTLHLAMGKKSHTTRRSEANVDASSATAATAAEIKTRQSLRIKSQEGKLHLNVIIICCLLLPYSRAASLSLQAGPAKPKRKRITQEQFQALSALFQETDTPNFELREQLAKKLNMTNREVQV